MVARRGPDAKIVVQDVIQVLQCAGLCEGAMTGELRRGCLRLVEIAGDCACVMSPKSQSMLRRSLLCGSVELQLISQRPVSIAAISTISATCACLKTSPTSPKLVPEPVSCRRALSAT